MKHLFRIIMIFLCTLFAGGLAPYVCAETQYTFGIVPQQSASRLARLWIPILNEISRTSDVKLVFRTAPNIPEFERRVAAGDYDFVYMNPYHYVVFNETVGYEAFARQMDKKIKGILVVRKDTKISNLVDLAGKTLAFPSPGAFAASMLTRAELKKRGIRFTPKYVSSHDSVYHAVAAGLYPAGGGILRTYNNIQPDVREKLQILWMTSEYMPHAFASHPRVDGEVVMRVKLATQKLSFTEKGKALLQRINFTGIEGARNSDWNDVRALNLMH